MVESHSVRECQVHFLGKWIKMGTSLLGVTTQKQKKCPPHHHRPKIPLSLTLFFLHPKSCPFPFAALSLSGVVGARKAEKMGARRATRFSRTLNGSGCSLKQREKKGSKKYINKNKNNNNF